MKGFTGRAKLKQIAKLYGPFATALLFGAFIKIYLRSLADLPNELADALIIAGLIGLAIEIWSKQVLIDDVADILSERLVGYRLPRKAQAVIGNLVLKSKIVLRDYCATFQFTRHPSKSGYLMVRMVISYKALNNGMEPTKYPCGMSEELIYKPTLESLRHGSQTYSGNAISPIDTATQRCWKPTELTLQPSEASAGPDSLTPDQFCIVRWVYTMEMPERYTTVVSFGAIVIEPEVRFDPLQELPLKFYANPDETCEHSEGSSIWRYRRAFIKDQCIRVWWEPLGDSAQDA